MLQWSCSHVNSSCLCLMPYNRSQVSHVMRKKHAQLQLPGWMSKDTSSGSAGQKPNAGATPQVLDPLIGQHKRLKSGVVIVGMPKIKERY